MWGLVFKFGSFVCALSPLAPCVLQLLGLCGMGFILWPKAQNSYVVLDEERDNPYDGL